MNRLKTKIGNITLNNPVMTASGTSGHSNELSAIDKFDINSLGAFVTKSVTLNARKGNKQPRIVEVPGGILNSIGLQNKGVYYFIEITISKLQEFNIPIIVNVSAPSKYYLIELYRILKKVEDKFDAIEVNLSCPNAKGGIIAPLAASTYIRITKDFFGDKTTIAKLSPNTNTVMYAEDVIGAGVDAISMINTIKGMVIDIDTQKPLLGNVRGGLSGPCIKPIGVQKVYECFNKIPECKSKKVPIIGIGGIMNYKDALEYILAGASAVGIGTGFFTNPFIFEEVKEGINKYLLEKDKKLEEIVGISSKE